MARMKTEFLHHWRVRHGNTLGERLIAGLPLWAPWASRLAPIANLPAAVPVLGRMVQGLMGWSTRRSLPRWRTDGFLRGLRRRTAARAPTQTGPEVVLWVDTFNDHLEPDNARAALQVLRAAGCTVHVAGAPGSGIAEGERGLCCGRTWLSAGDTDRARHEALRTLRALLPFARRGVPIVGLEPSCLMSLRDEFLALRLDEAMGEPGAARTLANQAVLFEEFLVRALDEQRLTLPLKSLPQSRARVHGHCHQKAFDAFTPTLALLRRIPGLVVEPIASGCCGMAGSFGYQARHDQVSMQMAELDLLPAVRAASGDTLIVADGTSCRHQIADGASREALHVARVMAQALA
jgi:Fe-S oxidoreductase